MINPAKPEIAVIAAANLHHPVGHDPKYKPWRLLSDHYFAQAETASAFERYLKSGSGRAFSQKRLR